MSFKHICKQADVSISVKDYAEERFSKLTKLLIHLSDWQINYQAGKRGQYQIDVVVFCAKKTFKASETADSFFSAIDQIVHKLGKQIFKIRSQIHDHKNFASSKEGKLLDMNSRLEYRPHQSNFGLDKLPMGAKNIALKKSAA